MKSAFGLKGCILIFIVLAFSMPASASMTIYEKEDASVSVDGYFNVFYANSDSKIADTRQARVKMGFLPNTVGIEFKKKVDGLELGGRSSFWVTINDSDDTATDTAIDVRQFYGTIKGDFGKVLIGKDFTLFNRSNIFLDEVLQGFGKTGTVDSSGVSFGNIGSGYTYPMPSAQITYRTPDLAGFNLAIGLIDPTRTTTGAGAEEDTPRIEAEITYNKKFNDSFSLYTWAGFLDQSSENAAGVSSDSEGISYGLNVKLAGASLTASGFEGEGLSLIGPLASAPNTDIDSDGFLVQASYTISKVRLVASYGKTEVDTAIKEEDETIIGAVFYTVNDNLKLVADYSVEEFGPVNVPQEEIKTLALGAILTF